LQILVNLIRNAKSACHEGGPASQRIIRWISSSWVARLHLNLALNLNRLPPFFLLPFSITFAILRP
jgi:hypothetical protein